MKGNRFLCLFIFVVAGCLSSNLFAQDNLQDWVKKCENNSSLDMTVINNKDSETKKEVSKIIKIVIPGDSSLVNELMEAYDKDKGKANQSAEKRVAGVVRPDYCQFVLSNMEIKYLFEFSEDNSKVTVTVQYVYSS